jgi:hypothetical protein
VPFESAFTARVAAHPRVAYYRLPPNMCPGFALIVADELLIGARAGGDPKVQSALEEQGATPSETTLFDPESAPEENISVWRLTSTRGYGENPDVARAVWAVRNQLPSDVAPGEVGPNHVLVPSANFHTCPWGPPDESGPPAQWAPSADGAAKVVVIDSSYFQTGPLVPPFVDVSYGSWFTGGPTGGPPYSWVPQTPAALAVDPLDQDGDSRLDALVGHANFVAGVVAQACSDIDLRVVSHNGAFVFSDDSDTPIPTEASVARSLWESRDADVIDVGFAFPTLPSIPLAGDGSDPWPPPPSWAIEVVLRALLKAFRERERPMIVAPAGNQDCPTPQYPAAFGGPDFDYPNVVGVASLGSSGVRSPFSNYGPWVACSTEGEDVVSAFIDNWIGETEEAEITLAAVPGTHPVKNFTSGWAQWSGTSFAAPKVAGAIAAGVATGQTPFAAWQALQAQYGAPVADVGIPMRGLAPV